MRIAFFSEAFDPFQNGVVALVKAYRDALIEAGHEVVIFTPENDRRPTSEKNVVRMPSVKLTRELYPVAIPFAKALRRFDDLDFDIIHSHHPFSCGLMAEKLSHKFEIPLVYTFHTLLTQQSHYVPGPKNLAEKTLLRVVRRHCSRAHCVTVSGRTMQNWLRSRAVKSPVQIVKPDPPEMVASDGARERLRAKHNFRSDEVVAFCASRLSHEKDVELLVRSTALLDPSLNVRVLVAGSGLEEQSLKRLAKSLKLGNKIVWAGEVDHDKIADYYAASDFFAFPSRNDTLGLVVLEAMTMGLPCVVVNQNGPSEIVRSHVDGIQSAFDPVSFSNAMALMARHPDLRRSMGAAAPEGCRAFCAPGALVGLLEAYAAAQDMMRLDRLLGRRRGFTRNKRDPSEPKLF